MQILTFIFLCILWGTTWVAIKITLEGFPPFLGAAIRFAVALIFLLLYIGWKRISLKMSGKDFWIVSLTAFLMYTLDYGLIYWGEQHISAGVTSIFFATFPLFTGIWANFLFRNETFRWHKFLGLVLGFSGIFIVFYDQLIITHFSRLVTLATLSIIIGAAGGAMSVVMIKKYLPHLNPITLSFHQMVQGVFFLLLFGIFLEDPHTIRLSARIVLAVIYLGALGSALGFALYYWLLQTVSAITLSLIIYITPIVAIIVDYFVFGEVLGFRAIAGMLIIFSGIALTEYEMLRRSRRGGI